MVYASAEARAQLLDGIAAAADELALALACLGEAYERLDEHGGDRLEQELFRPVQLAYGRAKRTYAGFAERYGLPAQALEPRTAGIQSQGTKELIDKAVDASGAAGTAIAALQDSMMPVEVGDAELRAGLADVRELVAELPARARELTRTLGR